MSGTRRIVLGIGNPDRGDDAAGREAARRLRGCLPGDVEILEHDGEATALLHLFEDADQAYIIDACRSGAAAGTVRRFDAASEPLPEIELAVSTHGFGLAAAIELARNLGQLPPRCLVYAIEGVAFEVGAGLSAPVAAAVDDVVQQLEAELMDTEHRR